MLVRAAQEELEQYISESKYDCAGSNWGYCEKHYATLDDVNEGRVTSRTWTPTWGTWGRIVRVSRQLCIPGVEDTFPTRQAYAAQVNWNQSMRRLLSKEPTWRTDKVKRAPAYAVGTLNGTQDIYTLLKKKQPKWEGFSFLPKGEVS